MTTHSAPLSDTAQQLLSLHHRDAPVVLPTVWDVWSAHLAVDAGFSALTIGSHPVANSLGYPDGENTPLDLYFATVGRITAAVDVPVSVDVESGYGLDATDLVGRVLDAGAVGVNVEDSVHSDGTYRPAGEHADYIRAIRAAADDRGVHLVINGRTDAFTKDGDDPAKLDDALNRLALLEDAGADSLYPVGIPSTDALTTILSAVSTPVNITAHPVDGGTPDGLDLARAAELGVKRISFGPLFQAALADASGPVLASWLQSS
ncbi:MAG: isocitrate lyase/PEP mutase family protein [Mycobacteriaceae bacterium]|uniref:isocitrate lyase/PEP mutase family protein n=1 Tax=Corynebacterium sp. TaxID=1720 RepID=UPI003F999420